ncbi:MAG: hypothetical protein JWN04_4991 [Myxococcaceae bacterium]|nr:hypothetical protein [Myxococcaceae bacterium]
MGADKIAVYTGGLLDSLEAKMAHGILRYRADVVVVIDERFAGRELREVLPYAGKSLPIVADLEAATRLGIREVVLGLSPPGGVLPRPMIALVLSAAQRGLRVTSGLHTRLRSLPEVRAQRLEELVVDLRDIQPTPRVAEGACGALKSNVILTVGTDCASGKMTTSLELWKGMVARRKRAGFVATGQTGICIAGKGLALDAIVADFLAGAVETAVLECARDHDYVFVEGQGALLHPAYSGVTLGLMHGASPNLMVLCHEVQREGLMYFDRKIASLSEQIRLLEELASYQRASRVIAIALSGRGSDPSTMARTKQELERALRLPVFDPMAGVDDVCDLLSEF